MYRDIGGDDMSLNQPVPEGGRAGNIVVLENGGHNIGDGAITVAANPSTGAVTAGQYGTAADVPTANTPFWMKIGKDSDGYNLFMLVYKGAVDA